MLVENVQKFIFLPFMSYDGFKIKHTALISEISFEILVVRNVCLLFFFLFTLQCRIAKMLSRVSS